MSTARSRLLRLFLPLALLLAVSAPSLEETTADSGAHPGALRFSALDGSSEDMDGVVDGVWSVPHGMVLEGALVCGDEAAAADCAMELRVGGDLELRPGSGISADQGLRLEVEGDLLLGPGAYLVSDRGAVELSARGRIGIDGLVSGNGPNGASGENSRAGRRERSASVVLESTGGPGHGIRIGASGTVLSAGGSKAGNRVELSGCGLEVLGLVAAVESGPGPGSGAGVVLRSCQGLVVDGRDLEEPNGLRQGRIEVQGAGGSVIDLFARQSVVLDGAELRVAGAAGGTGGTGNEGNRIAVTSDQGSLSWRRGLGQVDPSGQITLTACDGVELTGSRIAPAAEIIEACAGVRERDHGPGRVSLPSSLPSSFSGAPPSDGPVPLGAGSACTLNLAVDNMTLSTFAEFISCNVLTSADTRIIPRGRVTYRAGEMIVLENGFSVEGSSQFVAILDPTLNSPPEITSDGGGATAAIDAAENQTAVTDVDSTDPDGETESGGGLTYSLSGADAAKFSIDASGILTFLAAPDFEAPGDADGDNDYEVSVTVTDASGSTDVQDITVTVTNVNEAPAITSDGGGATASVSIAENTTAVTDVDSSDPDGETESGGGLTYSLSGDDAAKFSIDAAGMLAFLTAPDFENPGDANADNDYEVTVTVTDAGLLTDTQDITVTVDDVNEAPLITSDGGGAVATVSVPESRSPLWARALGGAGGDQGIGVTLDDLGNVYTTGQFGGTVDFDPGPGTFNLTSAGQGDVFVSKLDSGGNFVWAAALGGAFSEKGFWVAVDASGNVYTTGNFQGTADFDPGPGTFNLSSAGGLHGFVSKLDGAGNFLWAVALGDIGRGVALDGSGNVYTTGHFDGTADFDPGPGTFNLTSAGQVDAFVSKLDSAGNFVWAAALRGAGIESALAVAVDGSGNAYTTGSFRGTADFDPGPGTFNLTSAGSGDAFVSKLDDAGNFVWARGLGGTISDLGTGVAVDGSGNVYTTGSFAGMADFDPGPGTFNLTSTVHAGGGFSSDAFVSKLDGAGNFVWARGVGGTSPDQGSGVAVDGSGNVYTTGRFAGTVDFDPGPGTFDLASAGFDDAFVSRLDDAGNFVWARALGGTSNDQGWSVAVDASGNVYTTGNFQGTADFDPGPGTFNLSSAGNSDAFVSKLDGGAVVTDVDSTDPEGETENGGGLTYSLTDSDGTGPLGSDNGLFTVNPGSGLLVFAVDPDFENPTDANADNDYEVQVTVTDSGGLTDVQDITVTVTNVNEAPAITSDGGGATASVNVPENQTAVTDVESTDPDGETRVRA